MEGRMGFQVGCVERGLHCRQILLMEPSDLQNKAVDLLHQRCSDSELAVDQRIQAILCDIQPCSGCEK